MFDVLAFPNPVQFLSHGVFFFILVILGHYIFVKEACYLTHTQFYPLHSPFSSLFYSSPTLSSSSSPFFQFGNRWAYRKNILLTDRIQHRQKSRSKRECVVLTQLQKHRYGWRARQAGKAGVESDIQIPKQCGMEQAVHDVSVMLVVRSRSNW